MLDTWSVTPIEKQELFVGTPYCGKHADCFMTLNKQGVDKTACGDS